MRRRGGGERGAGGRRERRRARRVAGRGGAGGAGPAGGAGRGAAADRDGLLLHHLVDRRAVGLLHLIELVDAADPLVGEHERAALEDELARRTVADNRRGQPDARRALAGGVDGAGRHRRDVLEQLRLGDCGGEGGGGTR